MLRDSNLLLDELIVVFDDALARRKPVIFSKGLVPFENRIDRLNRELTSHFDDLIKAISILYPDLARLLYQVRGFKVAAATSFGILLQRARFAIEFDGLHPFKKIAFTAFRDEVAEIDFDEYIRTSRMKPGDPWPGEELELNRLAEALEVLLVEGEFSASDFESLAYLRDRFVNQRAALQTATEMLRQFIADNFSMDDLLRIA